MNHKFELMKTSELRSAIGMPAATLSNFCKNENIDLVPYDNGKRKSFLKADDVKKILEGRGFQYPSKAIVIALMICKGGTGKSTKAYFLSRRLAAYGNKVLLIDADPQGNLTMGFTEEELQCELNEELPILQDVLSKKARIQDIVIEVSDHLHLIPSTPRNSVLDNTIRDHHKNPSLPLRKALSSVQHKYDYVIIDCAPALNLTNTTVVCAADKVLLPFYPDKFCKMSLAQTLDEIGKIEDDFDFEVEKSIVFSKFDQREITSLHYFSQLMDEQKDLMSKTVIRTSTDPKNSIAESKDLFALSKSTAKEDYDQLVREILNLDSLKPRKKRKRAKAEPKN